MNSYELSRAWFDFSFDNPEKIKPSHSAVYFFAIEHCNRLGWKEKFGFPSQMVMEAIGIKNWRTYSGVLKDLVDFGFIKMIEVSKNQYSANIIAIVKTTKATTKALDKALQKHCTKQSQSTVSIIKQDNKEQDNNKKREDFDKFRKLYKGTKNGLDSEFENFKKKYKNFEAIIPLLIPSIIHQEKARKDLSNANQFCPPWKNLSTWINNQGWDIEIAKPEQSGRPQQTKQYRV